MSLPRIELLPRDLLVRTSEVDHADWNYRPLLGLLQRVRFKLVASLLDENRQSSFLEIGYGSGVFFPHLMKHCDTLSGVDIHHMNAEVTEAVGRAGIQANLVAGDAAKLDFETDSFDCAIAVSSLEYVEAIDDACQEIIRVLKPTGTLVLVTPGQSPILDFGLKIIGGEDADDNYGERRETLISTLQKYFVVDSKREWPWYLPGITVYKALRLRPRGAAG